MGSEWVGSKLVTVFRELILSVKLEYLFNRIMLIGKYPNAKINLPYLTTYVLLHEYMW